MVNDSGPKGHSPFTWYVLQGLRGEAAQPGSEVITASDLMVYVKNQVGQKYGLQQVPDIGKLPGHESGGDFIFRLPAPKDLGLRSTTSSAATSIAWDGFCPTEIASRRRAGIFAGIAGSG